MAESAPRDDPYTRLTELASDCFGAFAGNFASAQEAYDQFAIAIRGPDLDEAAADELARLRAEVDRQEALIKGATIMVEHLGIPAPNGGIAWGEQVTKAVQMAQGLLGLTGTNQ